MRSFLLLLTAAFTLSACDIPLQAGPDGRTLPPVYRISVLDSSRIQYRALDNINALRQAAGVQPLVLSPQLNSAAATHSRDMSVQERPWHFGSDGSSPVERVRNAGYAGQMLGENISETYETELETIAAWMQTPSTRSVILDPAARSMGFSFYQESTGKIWWTMVTGG